MTSRSASVWEPRSTTLRDDLEADQPVVMAANRTRLLLVASDPQEVRRLRQILAAASPENFDVRVAWSATEGARELASERCDVLLLDLSMAADGLESFWSVCPGTSNVPIVALTPDDDQQLARQAIQRGAQEYLAIDEVTPPLLVRAVRYAQERYRWLEDRSRRLDHELQMAALIQERFLPSATPVVAGYEVGGHLQASGQIGGDFFDYIDVRDGRLGVVLGDASGKGIPGALLMAKAQAIVRAEAASGRTPADIVGRVNALIHGDIAHDQFVTLFYVVLSAHSREIRYGNAGHPRALLVRSDGVQHLPATGPPLGVFADAGYDEETAPVTPGDILVMYSDGVTEAQTAGDDFFNEAGVLDVVDRDRDRPAPEIARALCEAAERFERGNPDGGDDKAVVVVRVTGS